MKNTIMERNPSLSNLLGSVYNSTIEGLERCSSRLAWIIFLVLFIGLVIVLLPTFTYLGGPITTTAAPHTNPKHPTSTIEPSTIEPSTFELIWNNSDTALENMGPELQQGINEKFRRQEEELKKTEECRPVLVKVAVKSLLSPSDKLLDELYLKPENVAIYQCSGCNVGGCTGKKEGWSGVCGGNELCGSVDLEKPFETTINVNDTTDRLANIPLTKTLFLKIIYQGKFHVHQREVKQHNHCECRHH